MENDAALARPTSSAPVLAQLAAHTSRYVEAGLSGVPIPIGK